MVNELIKEDILENILQELKNKNEIAIQQLEIDKMNTEAIVTFIRMMNNFIGTWSDKGMQETVLDKLSNVENKIDNFILPGSNIDVIKNLVPVEWKANSIYDPGMVVSYEGKIYKVIQKHTSQSDWTPDVYKAGFVLIATPDDVEEVESGGCPAFVQPTGGHDAYNINDCVVFEGKSYVSLINGNVWSPTSYPAGWKLV